MRTGADEIQRKNKIAVYPVEISIIYSEMLEQLRE